MSFSNPKKNIAQFGLEEGMKVVDFGAGAGYLAVEAAEVVGQSGQVYVIDIQQALLTKAKHLAEEHHLQTIVFIHGDLEKEGGSTLAEDSVDAVILSNLLFQAEGKVAIMQEAYRILKKAGKLLLVDWSQSFGGLGPQEEYVFPEHAAMELAESVGFVFSKKIDAGAYHYGLIFKK